VRRTIPILRGLAILGVVFNHANWHVLSQFSAGAMQGIPFILFDQIGKFAIPAFMFIAGYFIAYATGGGKRDLSWQVIRARLENLLWPWLIWSAIFMLGQFLQGRPLSPAEYWRTLIIQYYFIPLLIFYYLLAPFIAKWAKTHTRALLIGAGIVQLFAIGLFYARVYHPAFPNALKTWIDLGPIQYLRFAFYFPFGVACGMFPRQAKTIFARFKTSLPWLTLLFFALSALEATLAFNTGGNIWPKGGDQTKLSSALFSTAFVLCFAAFDRLKPPFNRSINKLGTRSYGLYLVHYPILGVTAKIIHRLIPRLASQGWLLLPLLFALTVSLSMALMEGMARLPAKRFYHYLFG